MSIRNECFLMVIIYFPTCQHFVVGPPSRWFRLDLRDVRMPIEAASLARMDVREAKEGSPQTGLLSTSGRKYVSGASTTILPTARSLARSLVRLADCPARLPARLAIRIPAAVLLSATSDGRGRTDEGAAAAAARVATWRWTPSFLPAYLSLWRRRWLADEDADWEREGASGRTGGNWPPRCRMASYVRVSLRGNLIHHYVECRY